MSPFTSVCNKNTKSAKNSLDNDKISVPYGNGQRLCRGACSVFEHEFFEIKVRPCLPKHVHLAPPVSAHPKYL